MGPGHLILYSVSFFCLLGILIMFIFNRHNAIIHLIIFFTYSIMLYCGIFFKGTNHRDLVYAVILLALTGLHILYSIIYFFVKTRKAQMRSDEQK